MAATRFRTRIEECRGTPYSVRFFWSPTQRVWVVGLLDAQGKLVDGDRFANNQEELRPLLASVIRQAYELVS